MTAVAPTLRRLALLALVGFAACAPIDDEGNLDTSAYELSGAARRPRLQRIRDVAAAQGLTNGALLGGIAQVETGLSHCWSEATWACRGPNSTSCNNGPVIAGASDGPCSAQQGGLGMFQFDGGTFSQTLARDGRDILTLDGNIRRAVEFVATIVRQEVSGVSTRAQALAWINSIPIVRGDARFERWMNILACRYNGACGSAAQATRYRDATLRVYAEVGASFWRICTPSAEVCNGRDDDCDGRVDDGLAPVRCGVGACMRTVSCTSGRMPTCAPGRPGVEVCNGVDDDCDGRVDDGIAPVRCGVGACMRTVTCTAGRMAACVAGAPRAEVCGNGVDDDCDGQVDDGCTTDAGTLVTDAGMAEADSGTAPWDAAVADVGTETDGGIATDAGAEQTDAGTEEADAGEVLPETDAGEVAPDDVRDAPAGGMGCTVYAGRTTGSGGAPWGALLLGVVVGVSRRRRRGAA